jgi:hypothetical protein
MPHGYVLGYGASTRYFRVVGVRGQNKNIQFQIRAV